MFRYYFILLIFFISNIFSQEISPIQSFTASDYNADIQNWMITQAEDNSIVVANSSGILHYNRDWNFYPSSKNTIVRSVKSLGNKIYSGTFEDFGYWLRSSTGQYMYTSLPELLRLDVIEDEEFWDIHEISNWINDDKQKFNKIKNDPIFLQKCVHESMRLHPASPVAWRKPTCPVKIEKSTHLKEDDLLIMDLYTANRDVGIFGEDANSFNPDRKLKSHQNLWGLTFGIGLHMCFGRDLDGGVSPNRETDPSKHQYGVVTLLIKKLFEHNVQRDPKNKPERDIKTERPNWGKYPVIFGEKK